MNRIRKVKDHLHRHRTLYVIIGVAGVTALVTHEMTSARLVYRFRLDLCRFDLMEDFMAKYKELGPL